MLLAKLLRRLIRTGKLTVHDARGRTHVFGSGTDGPAVVVRLHDRALHWKLFFSPMLASGEAYMDGRLAVEEGDIYDLVELVSLNMGWGIPDHWVQRLFSRVRHVLRPLAQHNPMHRARRNVAHHYDLSGELYELFLDSDRQYSCAYFRDPDDDIELAQWQKKQHLAAKLRLAPGQRVLDIGSGWGGLGLHLARTEDIEVTGVTLSEEQHKVSNARAESEGLSDRVQFYLRDYRAVDGRFDRIVSVGMFEHVGVRHYGEYFGKVAALLEDDGIAVLHTIGRADGPGTTNPWIRKYIFPGGYSPALSEVAPAIERAGLYITDFEVLRLHYAQTLHAWRDRFQDNRERVRELYDERFCRMWELYLAAAECAFRYGGHVVFQIQMARSNQVVPDTRDYITDYERAAEADAARARKRSDSRAA